MSLKLIGPALYLFPEIFKVMRLGPTAFVINKKRSYYCHSVWVKALTSSPFNIKTFRGLQVSSILQKCWKCGADKIEGLFCSQCRALQKPDDRMNYFQVLGVAENYNLKDSELSLKYRKLQSFLHPDRYTNKEKIEQEVSAEYSALVNKAYSTLLHPLQRGLYMLQMRGLQLEEGTVQDDPAFLTSMMELNEELEEANDPEDVRKLETANRLATEELTQEVANAFDKGDLMAAKRALTKMKYYASIGARIKELKQKLSIE